jgi:hypothetical protein
MGWLRSIAKYLPMAWIGIKALWAMYKARLRQEGLRDALKNERDRRIRLERNKRLADRLDDSPADRLARFRLEREQRASDDKKRQP